MLIVCSLFLLSLTSQVLDGLPRVLAFDTNTVSSFFWHSGRVILPWCQLKLVHVNTYVYQWKKFYGLFSQCFSRTAKVIKGRLIDISMLVTNKITFHLRICFPRIFASCHGYYFQVYYFHNILIGPICFLEIIQRKCYVQLVEMQYL